MRSRLFFSNENIQSRVADPVSFLLIPLRALECWRSPPSTLLLAEWLARMGQDLFNPPNVGGWTGGRGWLSTRTIIARANYATAITAGQLTNPERRPDMPAGMAAIADLVERLCRLGDLLCGGMSAATVHAIIEKSGLQTKPDELLWHCVNEFVTRPETQLH